MASAHATVIVRQIDPVDEGWALALDGSFADETGSTQKRDYKAAFNLSHRRNVHEMRAFGGVSYGRVNGAENTDNHMLHMRYIRSDVYGALRFEGFVQTESDDFASLSRRNLLGGVVSRFFNKPDGTQRLLAMIGVMREEETHVSNAAEDRDVTRATASLQARWQLPRDNRLYFISYVQPNLEDMGDDMRVTAELSLEVPLSDRLSLTTGYNYRYNDKPFENVPREKTKFSTGFKFAF
jgi:putative salt-induced outer membrane protein YdiY